MTWGPVQLFAYTIFLVCVGLGIAWLLGTLSARKSAQFVAHRQKMLDAIETTKRLLAEDPNAVGRFMDDFGRDLLEEFGNEPWAESLKRMTLDDLRNHVEVAVFDLVKGCHCGHCTGISSGGPFWIEASYADKGLRLTGIMAVKASSSWVDCKVTKFGGSTEPCGPGQNITLVCEVCKERPVVTSIDHIAEGKKPTCATCATRSPSA